MRRQGLLGLYDSLYLRLALVLAAALICGFATMAWLFQRHLEQDRGRGDRHGMAGQIRLIEALLAQRPAAEIGGLTHLPLVVAELPANTEPGPPADVPTDFASRMSDELERPVELRHPAGATSGIWIHLAARDPTWLFLPPPPRHLRRGFEPWTWGLLVGFAVVLVGGMTLLWRVQVPLRKLERALDQTRPATEAPYLELEGPRVVRSLAEQFNRMTGRLRQHEQDREVMLAGVAHDLRAPVTRLRLQLELAEVAEMPRKEEMLRNLDSVEAIVDQFLLFARGGDGEPATEWDLGAFVAEVVAPYEGRGVGCRLPSQEVIAAIQPSSLRRALCNLIDNALEYGRPPVEVSLQVAGNELLLAVADAGPGISAAQRALALRPFTRLDPARSAPGHCGLGLAIVARVAAAHDGVLELDRGHLGQHGGLVARLRLPAKIAVPAA